VSSLQEVKTLAFPFIQGEFHSAAAVSWMKMVHNKKLSKRFSLPSPSAVMVGNKPTAWLIPEQGWTAMLLYVKVLI